MKLRQLKNQNGLFAGSMPPKFIGTQVQAPASPVSNPRGIEPRVIPSTFPPLRCERCRMLTEICGCGR